MTGMTETPIAPLLLDRDTRYYWNLTRQIFRYNHKSGADGYTSTGVHSVNEAFKADAFVETARWFALLILNSDVADLA